MPAISMHLLIHPLLDRQDSFSQAKRNDACESKQKQQQISVMVSA
jgi:hypothetical protein